MTWRALNTSDRSNLWRIAGDLIPLHPKMEQVPVKLEPTHGNPNSPTTTTISRRLYQSAQRCSNQMYYDGSQSSAIKLEDGILMVEVD